MVRWPLALGIVFCLFGAVATDVAEGQINLGGASGGGGGGQAGQAQVTQQTGESAQFLIQRSADAFVGASAGNFLSRTNTNTGGARSTGVSGFNLNSSLGGLGNLGALGAGMGMSMGMGGFGRNSMFGMNQNMMNQGMQNSRTQLRTQIDVGFSVPPRVATEISARFTDRLPKLPGLASLSGVTVTMDGQTAVLQGVVASESQRDLIARLAKLEPGIGDVRNELTVAAPADAARSSAPAEEVPASTP